MKSKEKFMIQYLTTSFDVKEKCGFYRCINYAKYLQIK